jgi:hypothetical protein
LLDQISALPDELGQAETLLADSGYFSEANVEACAAAGIEPLIPQGRQTHYPPLSERFAQAPSAPENPTPLETMAHRLKTPEGKNLYALRRQTPEPEKIKVWIFEPYHDWNIAKHIQRLQRKIGRTRGS